MSDFEWSIRQIKQNPFKSAGIILFLAGRYLFAIIFLYGFGRKFLKGWLWSDLMHVYFLKRFAELPVDSFQAIYLHQFAIPLAFPIAWIVTIGELIVGLGLVFGFAVRANAAFALFLVLNFAAGGFYNFTLPPFMIFALMMIILPSGQWFGLDRKLHNRYPASIWFK
jgi:thiosulfate dehydrogenase [quinone] large subunit